MQLSLIIIQLTRQAQTSDVILVILIPANPAQQYPLTRHL
jgi:hypothetical protein